MRGTHIGTWARERGVDMDRLYATEPREGGTPALDLSIPALSRADLSIFSADEWERRKSTSSPPAAVPVT